MDSFKGSLSARNACEATARGLRAVLPEADIRVTPLADGGEGTGETVLAATGGAWTDLEVMGPLPEMRVRAAYVWMPDRGPAALVEMARASGLELLSRHGLDPMRATTYGTGELIAAARTRGAERVWLAIGGSATVDGGTGAARALGWRFLDRTGREVALGGGGLEEIARVAPPETPVPAGAAIEVLCDVENPLLGPRGAARVFGPQKGATDAMVERLEAGLANLADVVERQLGRDVRTVRGGGAAGGLGAGAVAFLDASLVSGVTAVMDAVGLDEAIADADWVVTGEGRLDESSLEGKVVTGVVERARRLGCRVAAVAGSVALPRARLAEVGIEVAEAAAPAGMQHEEAMARAQELVERAATRLGRTLGGSGSA